MFDEFFLRAALAGLGVALAAGPLGAFIVWRRMAYFGDATAHAAILGVALALALSLPVMVGTLIVALFVAVAVTGMTRPEQATDTLLGVISHGALAVGLLAFAVFGGARVSLESYLFGDILAVHASDLWVIWGGAGVVVALLVWRWQALLTATLNEELATASGIDPKRERFILTVALALVVAVALKVVGALLIGAMLIIPAAAARNFARSPEAMAVWAIALGAASVLAGLLLSFSADVPAGPSIICAALAGFIASTFRGAAR